MLEPATDAADYANAVDQIRQQVDELQQRFQDQLPMWVVFGPGTTDHPGLYVARFWLTLPAPVTTSTLIRAASLEELRDLLPIGLVRLDRNAEDDVNIIETWL